MRTKYRLGLLFLAAIFLASCADGPIGLFESIERERKIIDDRGLDNNLSVAAIAKASTRYFIAGGSLWYRDAADPDYPITVAEWKRVTAPVPATANYVTQSVVAFHPGVGTGAEQIYAVFTNQDGTAAGIYLINPAGAPPAVSAAVFGTSNPGVSGLGELFVANDGGEDYLLVVAKDNQPIPQYSVYWSYDGVTFSALNTTLSNFPVIDIAGSGTDIAYLTRFTVVAGTITYPNVDDNVSTDIAPPTGARTPRFGGLFFGGGKLWLSDNEGYLYSDDGFLTGVWSAVAAAAYTVSSTNTDPLPFTDFAVANGTVVVGSQGYGYRELGLNAAVTPVTPDLAGSNYQASELAKSAVLTFFVDPVLGAPVPDENGVFSPHDGDLLFAGTSNAGLWKALYYGQPPQWLRE